MKQITIVALCCSLFLLSGCWKNKEKEMQEEPACSKSTCSSCDLKTESNQEQPSDRSLDTGYERSEGGGQDATGTGLGM